MITTKEQLDRIEEALFSIEVLLRAQPEHVYTGRAVTDKLGIDWSYAKTISDYDATNITEVLAIPDSAFKKIRGQGAVRIEKLREKLSLMLRRKQNSTRNWKN